MSLYKRPNGYWYIDIKDSRIPEGRFASSAKTKKKGEAEKRHAVVLLLVERGELDLLGRISRPGRAGGLHIAEVQRALSADDMDALKVNAGGAPELEPHLLGAAANRLLQRVEANTAAGTLDVYQRILGNLEAKFGVQRDGNGKVVQDVPLARITSDEVQDWLTEPKVSNGGRPWSPTRQSSARTIAKKLFRIEIARAEERADRDGGKPELRRNPLDLVERPRVRQTRVVFLKPAEWRVLIRTAVDLPIAAGLGLWCLAGLRQMEAAHLRTGIDLVLEGLRPFIEIQPRKGEHPWRPKTDRSIRRIPIHPGGELHRLLLRHVELGYAGERYFIHPAKEDRPYGPIGLRKLAKDVFLAAGIKWGSKGDALSIHSLRHTFVSWLVQRDVQALKIARLIGDRPEQVYNTYGHLYSEDLEAVVAMIDAVAEERGRAA